MDIQSTQEERGLTYGKFKDHTWAVEQIMGVLALTNAKKNDAVTPQYPHGFETSLFYMVTKLVRLSATPTHKDSALDLSSYADLWLKEIQDDTE